ncbi:TPA: hypothetical protein SMI48_000119 [Serratia marcescens]|nr:hypothetical protein [Serratia marcescens]HEJ8053834.1 hypothetical protein [Serratia marcescens]
MKQRIIAPDIHPVMSVIDKKRKQKAAQPGYANGALLLFRAVTAKETRRFQCTDFNQEVCRHLYHLMLFLRLALNESFTFGFLAAYCLGSV